jgi:hypothetical protein
MVNMKIMLSNRIDLFLSSSSRDIDTAAVIASVVRAFDQGSDARHLAPRDAIVLKFVSYQIAFTIVVAIGKVETAVK